MDNGDVQHDRITGERWSLGCRIIPEANQTMRPVNVVIYIVSDE